MTHPDLTEMASARSRDCSPCSCRPHHTVVEVENTTLTRLLLEHPRNQSASCHRTSLFSREAMDSRALSQGRPINNDENPSCHLGSVLFCASCLPPPIIHPCPDANVPGLPAIISRAPAKSSYLGYGEDEERSIRKVQDTASSPIFQVAGLTGMALPPRNPYSLRSTQERTGAHSVICKPTETVLMRRGR